MIKLDRQFYFLFFIVLVIMNTNQLLKSSFWNLLNFNMASFFRGLEQVAMDRLVELAYKKLLVRALSVLLSLSVSLCLSLIFRCGILIFLHNCDVGLKNACIFAGTTVWMFFIYMWFCCHLSALGWGGCLHLVWIVLMILFDHGDNANTFQVNIFELHWGFYFFKVSVRLRG